MDKRKKELIGLGIFLLVFMGSSFASEWNSCGANTVQAIFYTLQYGKPSSLECISVGMENR